MACLSCANGKHYIQLAVCLLVICLVFTGHKCAIMFAHIKVLESLDEISLNLREIASLILLDGFPGYVPILVIVVIFFVLAGMSCRCAIDRQKNVIMNSTLVVIVFTSLCTLAEIGVVLFKDILLFLRLKAEGVAICYCLNDTVHNPATTAMPMSTESLYTQRTNEDLFWCRCNVPGEEYPVGLSLLDPTAILDAEFLNKFLEKEEYDGDTVRLYNVHSKEDLLTFTDNEFSNMKMLLAMVELSVFFVVVRMPVFFIIGRAMAAETNTNMDSLTIKHLKIYLEIVVFAFIESLDAFSLLDDVLEHRYTFGGSFPLTIITLVFVLLNCIVVHVASIAVFFMGRTTTQIPFEEYIEHIAKNSENKRSTQVKYAILGFTKKMKSTSTVTKLLVVIFSNVPFVALRCYLLYAYDGFGGAQVSSVYVIFIIKEIVIFALGITEFAITRKDDGD